MFPFNSNVFACIFLPESGALSTQLRLHGVFLSGERPPFDSTVLHVCFSGHEAPF